MFPVPLILYLLVLTSPLCLIFDGPIAYGLVGATTAVMIAIVGIRIRPGEAEYLSSLLRRIVPYAALPILAILFQLMPLKSIGFTNAIWQSAAAALSRPIADSITIDPGATLICLARYLALSGLAIVATAVSIDRRHAGWVLSALTVTTTLTALVALAVGFGADIQLNGEDRARAIIAATDSAVLGIILAIAAALQTLQRSTIPSPHQDSPALTLLTFMLCLAAMATCALAVFQFATSEIYIALMFGVATLVVAVTIRRFQLDAWGYSAVVATIAVVAIAALALRLGDRVTDFTFVFATSPQSQLVALSHRIMGETSWLGTGAGTFAVVVPIYRGIDELAAGTVAPTAATAIAIEMGKPFLWLAIICCIALITMLLRGAAQRGRDSLYSTAGASCVVATMLLGFNNPGVFNTLVLVVMAVTIGLAIAQSKSRSV